MKEIQATKPVPQATAAAVAKARPSYLTAAEGKLARRTGALFKALSTDFLLREQFVTDPSQVLGEFVLGERPSADAADAANQLVYAVMSNPRLRNWLGAYGRYSRGNTPLRDAFAHSFAKAVARVGDDATVLALIRGASGEHDHFALQADLLRALVGLIGAGGVFASGTEMSGPGTEQTPGPGGTEHSVPGSIFHNPGSVFSGTEMSGPGTEQTPGPGGTEHSVPGSIFHNPGSVFSGTEMSGPGTEQTPGPGGTEHSVPGSIFHNPGSVFSGTEMSGPGTEQTPGTGGTEHSVPGSVFNNPGSVFSGTEISGPGTEQTPGPGGTEHSVPGMQNGSWQLAAHLQVSFAALVQYSNLLRARGALHRSGMEGR